MSLDLWDRPARNYMTSLSTGKFLHAFYTDDGNIDVDLRTVAASTSGLAILVGSKLTLSGTSP